LHTVNAGSRIGGYRDVADKASISPGGLLRSLKKIFP